MKLVVELNRLLDDSGNLSMYRILFKHVQWGLKKMFMRIMTWRKTLRNTAGFSSLGQYRHVSPAFSKYYDISKNIEYS